MNARRPLIAANWKMNLDAQKAEEWWQRVHPQLEVLAAIDLVVAPTALVLSGLATQAKDSPLAIFGQNIHPEPSGAFTGEISAPLLLASGAAGVLVGHSERRQYFGETDEQVRQKVLAAKAVGLEFILCVGESESERLAGDSADVVRAQLAAVLADLETVDGLIVAYEPVWAIGTGRRADTGQIAEMHAGIRKQLQERYPGGGDKVRLLYGGSVKPDSAAELFSLPDVDGALIGGASLEAGDFITIAQAAIPTGA